MYHLAIIDHQIVDQKRIEKVIEEYCDYHHILYTIDKYTNPLDFHLSKHYDALFLEIDMPQENGIKLARRINELYHTKIIFISNHLEYIQTSFDAHPFHFIYKDHINIEGIRVLHQLFDTLNKDHQYIDVYVKNKPHQIRLSEIYYIDVEDHLCTVHLQEDNQFIQVRGTLVTLYTQLKKDGFTQINRSTLINMKHMKSIYSNQLTLKNNITLPLTKKYKTLFEEDYVDYLLNRN